MIDLKHICPAAGRTPTVDESVYAGSDYLKGVYARYRYVTPHVIDDDGVKESEVVMRGSKMNLRGGVLYGAQAWGGIPKYNFSFELGVKVLSKLEKAFLRGDGKVQFIVKDFDGDFHGRLGMFLAVVLKRRESLYGGSIDALERHLRHHDPDHILNRYCFFNKNILYLVPKPVERCVAELNATAGLLSHD